MLMSTCILRKEEIAEIARIAAAEVLGQRETIIQEEFDSRYHDVKLLMKNYRMLKAHYAQVSPETLEYGNSFAISRALDMLLRTRLHSVVSPRY